MSLVSSLSGAISWNARASEIEYRYESLMEKINSIMSKSSDIGEAISRIENSLCLNHNRVMMLQSAMASETDAGKKAQLASLLNSVMMQLQTQPNQKMRLKMEKHRLHKQEKELQKEKELLDVQRKFAQQTAEAMEKMEDAAIKRLAIRV